MTPSLKLSFPEIVSLVKKEKEKQTNKKLPGSKFLELTSRTEKITQEVRNLAVKSGGPEFKSPALMEQLDRVICVMGSKER